MESRLVFVVIMLLRDWLKVLIDGLIWLIDLVVVGRIFVNLISFDCSLFSVVICLWIGVLLVVLKLLNRLSVLSCVFRVLLFREMVFFVMLWIVVNWVFVVSIVVFDLLIVVIVCM